MTKLKGIHHVTAITSSAEKNYEFFTYVLGMRLVKKTVNQDDIQTYHLFFADDKGSAGTDVTFFDFPNIHKGYHGTNEIHKTSFRVPTDEALQYWLDRFNRLDIENSGIQERFGKKILPFVDFDDQRYELISDEFNEGVESGTPWINGPIPLEYAITGLGPVYITIDNFERFKEILETVFDFKMIDTEGKLHLFEVGEGGNGASLVIEDNDELSQSVQGYGTIHHVAFRVNNREELDAWNSKLRGAGFPTSGYVNRYYFESLYARVSPYILFEFATDGPGFMEDEPYETLGEKLSLPPFLEEKRDEIESLVRPIDTVRSTIVFEKE